MVYFVRHGQTDSNVNGIIQGQLDSPLNDEGIKQAVITADKLKNTKIDIIYSSPLSRAYRTSQEINKYHNVKIIQDDRLKEQNAGIATGRKYSESTQEEIEDFMKNPHKYQAEDFQDLYNRNVEFFKAIEKSKLNILIVSHSGVWKMLKRYVLGLDINDEVENIENCEVKILKKWQFLSKKYNFYVDSNYLYLFLNLFFLFFVYFYINLFYRKNL